MNSKIYFDEIFDNSLEIQEEFLKNIEILSSDSYFKIKYFKSIRFEKLKNHFKSKIDRRERINLVLGSNFGLQNWIEINKYIGVESVDFLHPNFFIEENTDDQFKDKCEFLKNKFVITTNHDICRNDLRALLNLQKFYLSCDTTIFAGWDWDNHHNLQISSIYASYSDFYFPSQRASEFEISRVSNLTYFIAPSAYEWTRDFLIDNLNIILNTPRNIHIFGIFNFYSRFVYRNQVIQSINNSIPEVKFINDFSDYTSKTQEDKLLEWASAKWHWVVPTLNAVSVRAFYALIAGVGVILPIEFKSFSEFQHLDERDVIWYSAADVIDTSRVIKESQTKFDLCRKDGILRRHRFALEHHNLNCRISEMIDIMVKNIS